MVASQDNRGAGTSAPGGSNPATPLVWVIGDERPGDTTQSIGLAQALGWPFTFKDLRFNRWARAQRFLLARLRWNTARQPWRALTLQRHRSA